MDPIRNEEEKKQYEQICDILDQIRDGNYPFHLTASALLKMLIAMLIRRYGTEGAVKALSEATNDCMSDLKKNGII